MGRGARGVPGRRRRREGRQAAVDAANSARDAAIAKANQEIDAAKKKFSDDVNKTRERRCPPGPDHDDCVARAQRMIADPKGESERNVAVCNQLKQYSEQVFDDCSRVPTTRASPTRSIGDRRGKAEGRGRGHSKRWWSIAGTIVAGAVIVGAGIFCAETAPLPRVGALVGAEAGFLAEAAGAGIGLTIGADFLAGVAADSFLASRLGALSAEEFPPPPRSGTGSPTSRRTSPSRSPDLHARFRRGGRRAVLQAGGDPVRPVGRRARPTSRTGSGTPGSCSASRGSISASARCRAGLTKASARATSWRAATSSPKSMPKNASSTRSGKRASTRRNRKHSSPNGHRATRNAHPCSTRHWRTGTQVDYAVYHLGDYEMETEILQALMRERAAGGR